MTNRVLVNQRMITLHKEVARTNSLPSSAHIKQEYQDSLIQGKIHNQ